MEFPVDLSLLQGVGHMPALPILEQSMNRPNLRLMDFCIPINAYFPTPEIMRELRERLTDVLRYYPSDNRTVATLLSDLVGVDAECIVAANGSTELITWINARLVDGHLLTDVPTFGRWTDNPRELGHVVSTYRRRRSHEFQIDITEFLQFVGQRRATSIAICNPNNPTGACLDRIEVLRLLDATRHLELVVIDESFIDFAAESTVPSVAKDAISYDNVIVIKSLGKNLGLHGLRCGYAVTNANMATKLRQMLPPWNVNSLAETFIRIVAQHHDDYEASRRRVVRDARRFESRLETVSGLTAFPTHANFVFCQLAPEYPGPVVRDILLQEHGCFIRECSSKVGSDSRYLRIASRPHEQQEYLIQAFEKTIGQLRIGRKTEFQPVGYMGRTDHQRQSVEPY